MDELLPLYFTDRNYNFVPYDVMKVALDGFSYRVAEAIIEACNRKYVGRQDRLQLRLFRLRNNLDGQFATYLNQLRSLNMLGQTDEQQVNRFIDSQTYFLSDTEKNVAFNGSSD